MYESPIELFVTKRQQQLLEQQENQIYQEILDVGIKVNKDRLIEALKYDLYQYQKGYKDGIIEFIEILNQEATININNVLPVGLINKLGIEFIKMSEERCNNG